MGKQRWKGQKSKTFKGKNLQILVDMDNEDARVTYSWFHPLQVIGKNILSKWILS